MVSDPLAQLDRLCGGVVSDVDKDLLSSDLRAGVQGDLSSGGTCTQQDDVFSSFFVG